MVVEALKREGLSLEQDTELQMRYMSLLGDRSEGEEALRRAEVLDSALSIGALLAARLQQARTSILQRSDAEQARQAAHDSVRRMDEMEVNGAPKPCSCAHRGAMREPQASAGPFDEAIAARAVGDEFNLMVSLVNVTDQLRSGDLDGAEQTARGAGTLSA